MRATTSRIWSLLTGTPYIPKEVRRAAESILIPPECMVCGEVVMFDVDGRASCGCPKADADA